MLLLFVFLLDNENHININGVSMDNREHLKLIKSPEWSKSRDFFDSATSLDMIPDLSIDGVRAAWAQHSHTRATLALMWTLEDIGPIHPLFVDEIKSRLKGRSPEVVELKQGIIEISYSALMDENEDDNLLHFGYGIAACLNIPEVAVLANDFLSDGETLSTTRPFYKGEEKDHYWENYIRLREGLLSLLPAKYLEQDYDFSVEQCLYLLEKEKAIDTGYIPTIRVLVEMSSMARTANDHIEVSTLIDAALGRLAE